MRYLLYSFLFGITSISVASLTSCNKDPEPVVLSCGEGTYLTSLEEANDLLQGEWYFTEYSKCSNNNNCTIETVNDVSILFSTDSIVLDTFYGRAEKHYTIIPDYQGMTSGSFELNVYDELDYIIVGLGVVVGAGGQYHLIYCEDEFVLVYPNGRLLKRYTKK